MKHSIHRYCDRCGNRIQPDDKRHKIDDHWVCQNCWTDFKAFWKSRQSSINSENIKAVVNQLYEADGYYREEEYSKMNDFVSVARERLERELAGRETEEVA